MSLKKCPACGEYFADTYKRCPFCEEEVNPRKVKKPKRNEGGGRRLSRREYEEDLPAPIYDDEPYRPRRSAADQGRRVEEASAYKGRRSREEDYDDAQDYDEEDYRPRRSAPGRGRREEEHAYRGRRSREEVYDEEEGYDDGYDEEDDYDDYDDDRGSPWFKIVLVILCAIILACVLYLARGPLGDLLHLNAAEDDHGASSSMISDDDPEPPQNPDDVTPVVPEVDDPGQETDTPNTSNTPNTPDTPGHENGQDPALNRPEPTEPEPSNTPNDPKPAAQALTLSHTDVTIRGGESFTLSVKGGGNDATYQVKDASVAKVSASGTVTGLKKGVTEVTVQRGSEKAKCIVRVSSTAAEGGETTPAQPSGTTLTLSKGDFTLEAGTSYTLTTPGISEGVTWSVGNASVATVSGGKVTAVAKGKTTVTATWKGQTAKCIVRVK